MPRSSNYYLLAIVIITAIGAGSVLTVIFLSPDGEDNSRNIMTILGFLTPTLLSLLTLLNSMETKQKVEQNAMQGAQLQGMVVSGLTEVRNVLSDQAYEEGRKRGAEEAQAVAEAWALNGPRPEGKPKPVAKPKKDEIWLPI